MSETTTSAPSRAKRCAIARPEPPPPAPVTMTTRPASSMADHEIRLDGVPPREALTREPVGYFGGESTLPARVQAARWGSLATGDPVMTESRHLRTLSRGTS